MAGPVPIAGAGCLVTGASSGIGRALAIRLAEAGARVCLHGTDDEALAGVAASIGGAPWTADDLRDPGAPARVGAAAARALCGVDILVNNAGVGWAGAFTDMQGVDIAELIAVDLTAPLALTREVLGGMCERERGHVVMVGSIAGSVDVPGEAAYAAAKAGLVAFADSLRGEVAGNGLAVSVVSPGPVETAFFERRGVPYARRFPRPVPVDRVVDAVVDCLRSGRPHRFVPRWLAVPARLRGAMPGIYRRAAAPFT